MRKAILFWVFALSIPEPAFAAPVALEAGWIVTPFEQFYTPPNKTAIGTPDVDAAGNVYVCTWLGIYRVDPLTSVGTLWSQALGRGLTTAPSGEAYLPTRNIYPTCYVEHIQPDGTFSHLASSSDDWSFAALAPSGTLYVNAWANGKGLYTMDRTTGDTVLLWNGGPAPNGDGIYGDMAVLPNDTLYVAGSEDAVVDSLYKWNGSTFTSVMKVDFLFGLCAGPNGTLLGAGGADVWRVDPVTRTATRIATGFTSVNGVAYDPSRDRIYLTDQLESQLYLLNHEGIPARPTTWGQVKALYR